MRFMNSLFTISFTKKLDADYQKVPNEFIFEKFKAFFEEAKCDEINQIETNILEAKNYFVRQGLKKKSFPWKGILRANLKIEKCGIYNRDITYSIDVWLLFMFWVMSIIIFSFIIAVMIQTEGPDSLFPYIIFSIVAIAPFFQVFMQYTNFKNALGEALDKYDRMQL